MSSGLTCRLLKKWRFFVRVVLMMHFHPVMREARRIAVSMCRHGSSFACRHDASVAPALAAGFDSRSATNWRRVVDSGLVKLGGVDCQRRLVHLAERERDCTRTAGRCRDQR